MIHLTIQAYLPKVIELFKKYKIKKTYIFWPALTDKFNNDSDVDFLVNLQEGLN